MANESENPQRVIISFLVKPTIHSLLCIGPLNRASDQLYSLQDACQLRWKEKRCCHAKVEEEELYFLRQH